MIKVWWVSKIVGGWVAEGRGVVRQVEERREHVSTGPQRRDNHRGSAEEGGCCPRYSRPRDSQDDMLPLQLGEIDLVLHIVDLDLDVGDGIASLDRGGGGK